MDRVVENMATIMVVDDNETVRRSLKFFIESFKDFRWVGEAADGFEAVASCDQAQPDLILMDINMPVLDGIGATQMIKEKFPDIHILAISAHHNPQQVRMILEEGADHFVLKDAIINELELWINQVLG